MSNGKKHDKLIWTFLIVNFVFLVFFIIEFKLNPLFAVPLSLFAYLFGGYYLSPDLDIQSIVYFRWKILRFIWIPYQKIIPHRSILSHGILIGSIIRVIYLLIIISIPLVIFSNKTTTEYANDLFTFFSMYKPYLLLMFCSLEISSDIHIFADLTSSKFKKIKKYFRK